MIVGIIQARMGSTRLPGKVLQPLAGQPMLQHVVERVQRASRLDSVLVATTTEPRDAEIASLCARLNCGCFRGSEHDVLDRYYQAARAQDATAVVRITADCPFIEPAIIDRVVMELDEFGADYCSNVAPVRTYPRGLDTEAFTFEALDRCWRMATDASSREHVTGFIYRHPELFRIHGVTHEYDESPHRWTVDTTEDYALAQHVYDHFGGNDFAWEEVLALLKLNPEWTALNAHIEQKTH